MKAVEDAPHDGKVQEVATGDSVDGVSTFPACGCITRRFVGSDARPGALAAEVVGNHRCIASHVDDSPKPSGLALERG
jgi:hypothetical protein